MRGVVVAVLSLVVLATSVADGWTQSRRAQRAAASRQHALRAEINEQALLLAAGPPGHSYVRMARDLARMLGSDAGVRLVPVMSGAGADNLKDLLYLRGVDIAIVPANLLGNAAISEDLGGQLEQRLGYIARLYGEELHLLAGRGAQTLDDLRGKKVGVPGGDGNALFAAQDIFRRLGIAVELVPMDPVSAADDVRLGDLAAMVVIGGKPMPLVAGLPKDGSLHLLSLPITRALGSGYEPAVLRSEDYPALIPQGTIVESVAIAAVLMAGIGKDDDASRQRVEAFIPRFFQRLTALTGPQFHPKWREVNLGAVVVGWTRLPSAQAWIDRAKQQQAEGLQSRFEEFLQANGAAGSARLSAAKRDKLFQDFIDWTRKSVSEPAPQR